jgi:C-terminal processing protease CtpA/Prc
MRSRYLKTVLTSIGLAALLALALPHLPQPPAQAAGDADYQRMRVFTEVLTEIENKYVEKKSQEELITEALKGMVSSPIPPI